MHGSLSLPPASSPGPPPAFAERRARWRTVIGGTLGLLLALGAQVFLAGSALLEGVLLALIAGLVVIRTLPASATVTGNAVVVARRPAWWSPLPLGGLVAALALNGLALWLLARPADRTLALGLYALSLGCLLGAGWWADGRPWPRLGALTRGEWLGLGALLGLALFFRLYRLADMPFGLWFDEAFTGLRVVQIMRDPTFRPVYEAGLAQQPALWWYLLVPFVAMFGENALALRLGAVLGGVLSVPAVFLLGRVLFGGRVGLLAGFVIAVLAWHVTFSRIAFNAIWSVTLDALAAYLFVRALRRRAGSDYLLAGLVLGLALNMYYTSRLLPVILGLYSLHRLARERLAFLRAQAPGLLLWGLMTLLTVSPLLQYAILFPREFTSRMEQVTIFKEVEQAGSVRPLLDNLVRHLLMFHRAGDRNGRHNLPGAPHLDPLTGALVLLGLALALARWRQPACGLVLAWAVLMLSGGVFSLTFEAPQALRTIDETVAVALLAALPLAHLGEALAGLGRPVGWLGRLAGAGLRTGGLVAAGGIAVAVAFVGLYHFDRYFRRQAGDFAVWAAFSTAETLIAQTVNRLPPETGVYLGERFLGAPTLRFLAPRLRDEGQHRRFDPALQPPFAEAGPVAVFLDEHQAPLVDLLRQVYPGAMVTAHAPPFGGPVVLCAVVIPADQVRALQGVRLQVWAGAAEGPPLRTETLPTVATPGPAPPGVVEWQGVLVAPHYGRYLFRLNGAGRADLWLDGQPVIAGGAEGSVTLARGRHSLRLRVMVERAEPLALWWQPPGGAALGPVPPTLLFNPTVPVTGLLGRYYQNPAWAGEPALVQIDPLLAWRVHLLPLPRPYSVEWTGRITVPVAGVYRFGTRSVDQSWLYIDERLVVDNSGAPDQYREGALALIPGEHTIRVRFLDRTSFTFIQVYWTPPGGQRQILPSAVLRPAAPAGTPPPVAAPPLPASPLPVERRLSLGGFGQGPGQFHEPHDAAVDSQGNIYVADTRNRRVQKFDPQGRFLLAWGGPGTGDGQFEEPFAIVVEAQDRVLVLDPPTGRLQRFTADGQFLETLGGPGAGFYFPRGLTLLPDGTLLLADTGTSRVVRLSPRGEVLGVIGERGTADHQLSEPTGVAVDGQGRVYVADPTNGAIVVYRLDGQYLGRWPIPRTGTYHGPHLAVVGDRLLCATDPENHRLTCFDLAGRPVGQLESPGSGAAPFRRPVGLRALADGSLLVVDPEDHRVHRIVLRP